MRLLTTGASGLLGAHVMAAFSRRHRVVGIDRHAWWGDVPQELVEGELAEPGFIESVIGQVTPDAIVHCAAMVNVDECERDPRRAEAVNGELTRRIARAAGPQCLVVYITTDGLFRGDTPFSTEADLPCPRTAYGRSKLRGEWEVQIATANHLIVRTNFFGWSSGRKDSSAEWQYRALAERTPITAFDDFFFTPIYVADFVERLGMLIDGRHRGLFHLCGRDRLSKYDFIMALAASAGFPTDAVRRGSIGDAHLLADRPRDMSLSSERFRRATGAQVPGYSDGVMRFLRDRRVPLSERFGVAQDGTSLCAPR